MNTKSLLFVANWKMNMPFTKAHSFIRTHLSALELLAQKSHSTIIICPSFIALSDIYMQTQKTSIKIGAQSCSEHVAGAYTGEVDALSLAQAGCAYTLVGHSERRTNFNESSKIIGGKIRRLLENNIIPIICVGETYNDYIGGRTFDILTEQIAPIITHSKHAKTIIIAYEPVWSIGSGTIPDNDYLTSIFSWLSDTTTSQLPTTNLFFLYGGSVNEHNAQQIIHINHVHGLLIGSMSLDFQKFQNIVSSSCDALTTLK